jgi:hypothetical protein
MASCVKKRGKYVNIRRYLRLGKGKALEIKSRAYSIKH